MSRLQIPMTRHDRERSAGRATPRRVGFTLGLSLVLFASACSKTTLGTEAYSLAVALDRVFEKQDPAQLEQARGLIRAQTDSGEISSDEAKALSNLVELAGDQRWDDARGGLRELLAAQTDW